MGNPIEILIIEDSRTQAVALTHVLESSNFKVSFVLNGEKALDFLSIHRPTLIISDIIMPEMDGFEFCKIVKSTPATKKIPILLVTNLASPHDVIQALQCGADGFLRKPYDQKYLISRIHYILSNLSTRNSTQSNSGIKIQLDGKKYFVTAERQQIFDLLLSTYEQSLQINEELKNQQLELRAEIFERKKIEKKLKLTTSELSDLYDQAPCGYHTLDYTGTIIQINQTELRWLQYNSSEVVGKFKFWELLTPESKSEFREIFNQSINDKTMIDLEFNMLRKDGSRFPILLNSINLENESLVRTTVVDITVRKKSEEARNRLIHEQAARVSAEMGLEKALFLADFSKILQSYPLIPHIRLKKTIEMCVPRAADWVVAYQVDENKYVKPVASVHADGNKTHQLEQLIQAYDFRIRDIIQTPQIRWIKEVSETNVESMSKNSEITPLLKSLGFHSYVLVPLLNEKNIFAVLLFVFGNSLRTYDREELTMIEDLTSRACLAIINSLLFEKLQNAIEVRDEFIKLASHELKTPLTTIKLQLQSLRRLMLRRSESIDSTDRFQKGMLVFERKIDRLSTIIDNLIDVYQANSGNLTLNYTQFNLSEVIQDIVLRFQPEIEKSGSAVELEIEPNLNGFWDKIHLEQAITNLFSNAIKFGKGKPISLQAKTDGNQIQIKLQDHGMGISKDYHPRMFERFARGVSVDSYAGLGLGLYVAFQITRAHGGNIQVESTPEEGTLFTLRIPANYVTSETLEKKAS